MGGEENARKRNAKVYIRRGGSSCSTSFRYRRNGCLCRENVPYETYNYDYYEDIKYTPAAYVPDGTVTGDVIGCGNFSSPQDLNTDADGNVYIADTGNNRIVVTDSDFQLKTVIEGFLNDGKEDNFSSPNGVYISENGYLYVADTVITAWSS